MKCQIRILCITFLENQSRVSLAQVLAFATGADSIPPLGFRPNPLISVQHNPQMGESGEFHSKFPIANTCANHLLLPLSIDYESFKEHMEEGILQAPGFGLA